MIQTFPRVHLEGDFRRPLRYGDRIEVEVKVLKMGCTSVMRGYTTYRAGEPNRVVVGGDNVGVCLNMETFTKREIPNWLRQGLGSYQLRCDEGVGVSV